jgi:hypothetical protein
VTRATVRRYSRAADYEKVGRFLLRTCCPAGGDVNWLRSRWRAFDAAPTAWVGTAMPFYLSFGFRPAYRSAAWERPIEPGIAGPPSG